MKYGESAFDLFYLACAAAVGILILAKAKDRAGKLMIPYIVWLSFAAYLNLGVWLLNR